MPTLIRTAQATDAVQIAAIYAPYVTDSIISFELEPPDAAIITQRILGVLPRWPWLVWERDGAVLGYAYASEHRTRAAYQWDVDVSAYVHPQAQRQGIGRALYSALFEILRLQGFYNALAGIALPNAASVGLHEAMGFEPVGVYPRIGYKFGAWHDVGWWQLTLREHQDAIAPVPATPYGELMGSQTVEYILGQATQSFASLR